MKSLPDLYKEHQGKVSDKWSIYLSEYDHLFSSIRENPIRMLEIGIQNGGSLEIWSQYFPNARVLVGCDINLDCARLTYVNSRIRLVIGDANTEATEQEILSHANNFDLIIDDGSHTSGDIAKSFNRYFHYVKDGGLFVAEDLHCSYWEEFDGGLYYPYSSMAFFKRLADIVNYEHWGVSRKRQELLRGFTERYSINFDEDDLAGIHSIEFFNSVCVVRKRQSGYNELGKRIIAGQHEVVCKVLHQVSCEAAAPSQGSNVWSTMNTAPEEGWLQITSRLAEREGQIASLNHELAEQEAQISSLKQELVEREGQITALRASNSWRFTAPLRSVSSQARRVSRAIRLLPDVISRGGGINDTARKAVGILKREGLSGVRIRLRRLEVSKLQQGAAVNTHDSIDRLQIVPYYIDPQLDVQASAALKGLSLAVHLHLFYPDKLEAITRRLVNIPCAFDLFVSISPEADRERIISKFRELLPRVEQLVVEPVPNRGRDLAPLIVQFGERLSRYAIFGHFHTKRSPHNANLENWCGEMLDQLLGAPGTTGGRLAHLFDALQTGCKIVYPEGRREFIKDRSGWADNYELARLILERHGRLSIDDFPVVEFPEGAMFWARTDCLQDLLRLPLTFDDFPAEPIAPDGTLAHALERLVLILASPYAGKCLRLHRGDSIADYRYYEPRQDYSDSIVHRDVKVLAYYLPQFHPIPENDAWHGEGFTEWTKVRQANPLFKGHYQQHIPHPDIGYYLLDSPDILRMQAELMRQSGVHGLVFYHYWFGGKLILEEPVSMLLAAPDIEMHYCFCWANENWTRCWDGNENDILLAQNYSSEDARAFIRHLIPFFLDSRYLCVDDRPVIYIYRPSSIPDIRVYLDTWTSECHAAGLRAPYVVAVLTRGATHPGDFGMDAGVERVLHDWTAGGAPEIKGTLLSYAPINGHVLSYDDVVAYYSSQARATDFTYFRSLVPMWDNTARYGSEADIVHGSTPEVFQDWLESLIQHAKHTLPADRRFILVNAWNEWAEGAHLEPDTRYGYSYLNAVGRALSGISYGDQINPFRPLSEGLRIHLVFPAHIRKMLADDAGLERRFFYCLSRSSIFERCIVTVDSDVDRCLMPLARVGASADTDRLLEFRLISIFSPMSIEQMLQSAITYPESVVIPNIYDGNRPLVQVSRNGSVESVDAYAAPMVLYPSKIPLGGYKNFRVRTDAECFVVYPNTLAEDALPAVTTIIRFHNSGDFDLLRSGLGCLAAMRNCICVPLIAAQDLSSEQTQVLTSLLDDFAWHEGYSPLVHHYRSANGDGDLRSKMLNESLLRVQTRYAGFLDYDDLIMSDAYEWLIGRLRKTGKAVSFGRVYSTTYNGATRLRIKRSRVYEFGNTFEEFVKDNHAPLHSFLIDLTKIDLSRIVYHEDQRYLEDYFMTLQLFTRKNADWASLAHNRYIGDYIHSIDRLHTLAIADVKDRDIVLKSPEYLLCENRIKNLRAKLLAASKNNDQKFEPFSKSIRT